MNLNGNQNVGFLESVENKIEKILALFLPARIAKTSVQFCKCTLVGVSNTLVDLAVFNALLFITGISRQGRGVVVLMGVSFYFAVTNSFIWNKKWTFRNKSSDNKALKKQIATFFLVSLGGLALNLGAGQVIVNVIGPHWGINPTLWANFGKITGIILTVMWNFTGYKLIVFRQ